MATQGYSGSVDLISGVRPKNGGTFPLVDAHDVYVSAPDVRLDETLKGKRGITDLAVYDRLADWTSSSGTVARWDHATTWYLRTGRYLEYLGGREWVLYDPSLDYVTHGITADEDALSLTFSVPVDGGEPEEITFTRPSVYASSGDRLAKQSDLQNIDLPSKLDASSAAPAFNENAPYDVGDYATHDGKLYRCTTAVNWQTMAPWNPANWTEANMTSPDATLDVTSAGRLRLVDTDGTVLWQQGYDLAAESSATLSCDKTNLFAFADTATTQAFSLPSAPTGKVGDFILDIDNSANTVAATATLTGLDTAFSVVVPSGQSLSQMLTFAAGEMAELYFTQTAFKVNNLPTWKLVKQVVENGGAQA